MKDRASGFFDLRLLLAILAALALGTSPFWVTYLSTYFTEASRGAYRDATWVASRCPPAVPSLRRAMADGILTRREAIDLGREMKARSDARANAEALAIVRKDVGGAEPKLPPACSTSRRDEGDYGFPLLRYEWEI